MKTQEHSNNESTKTKHDTTNDKTRDKCDTKRTTNSKNTENHAQSSNAAPATRRTRRQSNPKTCTQREDNEQVNKEQGTKKRNKCDDNRAHEDKEEHTVTLRDIATLKSEHTHLGNHFKIAIKTAITCKEKSRMKVKSCKTHAFQAIQKDNYDTCGVIQAEGNRLRHQQQPLQDTKTQETRHQTQNPSKRFQANCGISLRGYHTSRRSSSTEEAKPSHEIIHAETKPSSKWEKGTNTAHDQPEVRETERM
jgi:hypothetical protein